MASSITGCGMLLTRLNVLRDAVFRRYLTTSSCAFNAKELLEGNEKGPQYPPVFDTSYKASKEREVLRWHKLIQDLPTVEEKQLELNLAKYYGYWTSHLSSNDVRYNHSEFIQFATRSNVVESWPDLYDSLQDEISKFLPLLKRKVEDILFLELVHRSKPDQSPARDEKATSDNIIWAINHALVNLLCEDVDHIADSQSDLSPRLEAFWWLHGVPADSHQLSLRRGNRNLTPEEQEAPISRPVQFLGRPALQVRGQLPLPPLAPADGPVCRQPPPPPLSAREPRTRQHGYKYRHGTNVPGVWSDDRRQFALATWLTREHLLRHASHYGEHAAADRPDALRAQGCLAGFASCLAQACNLGFTPLTELTYPLTSQLIITNGRLWSFFAYQLNTTGALLSLPEQGALGNACWATPELALYERVTEAGVEGLNDEVLKKILEIYLLKTSDRDGINLRPYLDPSKHLDTLQDDWLRTRYRETFFHVMSNRPRSRLKDEVYLWEHIYKVRFQTRPAEARKRFFELNQFPGKRRLDEFHPAHVPRALRPDNLPARERRAAKFERNVFHEMAKLRGNRNQDPKFMQELAELESWRDK